MSATTTIRRSPTRPSRRIVTGATLVSVTAALAALAGQFVLPGGWAPLQVGVLVTGLLLGLPHGATDHLVLLRQATRRSLWVIVPAYATAAVVSYAAFRAWPVPAVAGFAVISGCHFATGEAQFTALRSAPGTALAPMLLAVGGIVLVLPVAAHPAGVRDVLLAVMRGHRGAREVVQATATLQISVLLALSALIAAAVVVLITQRRWLDAGELCLLTTLFAVVPPLAAFGVYFGCWHSVRHIGRLLTDEPLGHTTRHVGRRLSQFTRDAALPTAAALIVVFLLRWQTDNWLSFIATDLAVLAGLTVPHMLVVAEQDRALRRRS